MVQIQSKVELKLTILSNVTSSIKYIKMTMTVTLSNTIHKSSSKEIVIVKKLHIKILRLYLVE